MKARGLKIIILILIVVAAISAAVMLLWNALIPAIFGLAAINFWQALGLFVLARMLFGGFGRFGHGMMMRGGMHHGQNNPIREKWMKMSPEERKEFVNRRREFFMNKRGHWGGNPFDHMHCDNPHTETSNPETPHTDDIHE